MSAQLERRFFTVNEYARMGEVGIFSEDDRVELIEGEIVKMSPIGSRHAACVDRVVNMLLPVVADKSAIIRVQNPIILNDYSEPQPDVALLQYRADFYAQGHPQAADVLLVIEVADSSVEIDRHTKLPLYAASGIPETIIIVLPEDVIEVHAEPVNGQYQRVKILGRDDTLDSTLIASINLAVDDLLG